jgi:cytochrome P450
MAVHKGNLLGKEAMATVKDGARHQQLRNIFKPLVTDTEVARMAPGIQRIVQGRMAQWSKQPGRSVRCPIIT